MPWSQEMRYQPKGTISKEQAEEILNAVRDKLNEVLRSEQQLAENDECDVNFFNCEL